MDRLQAAFVALLLVAGALGGATALDTGSTLRAVDASSLIKDQVQVDVENVDLRDERLVVTTAIENPTGLDLDIDGARFRVYNASNDRLAFGAGERLDDGGTTLGAGETVTATYAVRLSPAQRDTLATALEGEAAISINLALGLGDTSIVVHADEPVGREA